MKATSTQISGNSQLFVLFVSSIIFLLNGCKNEEVVRSPFNTPAPEEQSNAKPALDAPGKSQIRPNTTPLTRQDPRSIETPTLTEKTPNQRAQPFTQPGIEAHEFRLTPPISTSSAFESPTSSRSTVSDARQRRIDEAVARSRMLHAQREANDAAAVGAGTARGLERATEDIIDNANGIIWIEH